MAEQRTFPVPPIVLDNRDGHLTGVREAHFPLPSAHLLVEGHRRFNIALHLASIGQLEQSVPFWLMERFKGLKIESKATGADAG